MKYDLIIIVASKDEDLRRMTQAAIDSCLADHADVNVILVETFKECEYHNVNKLVNYEGEFNYNRALNLGLKDAEGDIAILANNDIIFQKGWSSIGHTMQANGYLSASALSADVRQKAFKRGDFAYEGYLVGFHLTGWCIFVDRKIFKKIGKLDETFNFWYSDNAYADQLIKNKITHALICNVTVLHYVSRTLAKEKADIRYLMTHAERKKLFKHNTENIQKKL